MSVAGWSSRASSAAHLAHAAAYLKEHAAGGGVAIGSTAIRWARQSLRLSAGTVRAMPCRAVKPSSKEGSAS